MKIKHLFSNTFNLTQPEFRIRPKGFNPVDMRVIVGELIVTMLNSIMLCIAYIHKTMVTAPTIRMNDAVQVHFTPYYRLQRAFLRIWNDLRINSAVTLEQPKYNRFAARTTTTFAPNSFGPKVRFIDFYLARQVRMFFTFFCKPPTDFDIDAV